MPDILHLIKIRAFPERVYLALTTAEGVRQWWTGDADLAGEVGGEGAFRFHDGRLVTTVRIDALAPNSHIGWTVTASFQPAWAGTTIAFDLRPEGEVTALALTHKGFAEADAAFAATNTAWAHDLFSLRAYLQTGVGGALAPQLS